MFFKWLWSIVFSRCRRITGLRSGCIPLRHAWWNFGYSGLDIDLPLFPHSTHEALASLDCMAHSQWVIWKGISTHKALASLDCNVIPVCSSYPISTHKALANLDTHPGRSVTQVFIFQPTRLSRASTFKYENRGMEPEISTHKALASLDLSIWFFFT